MHLVEVLCVAQHLLHDLPALITLRAADHKLLHLLKLVNPAAGGSQQARTAAGCSAGQQLVHGFVRADIHSNRGGS